MIEQDITVSSGDISLAGTLTLPDRAGPHPLVICAHGTGQHDRNEGVLHVFDAIAQKLADHGVATYRFDKRGAGKSKGNFMRLGYWDFFSDFRLIFDHFAPQRPSTFSHIIGLGHSEGTIMCAELSIQRELDGIILLSPFIEDLEKVLMDQAAQGEKAMAEWPGLSGKLIRFISRFAGRPLQQQRRIIDAIKSSNDDVVRVGLRKLPAKHLRELMALDARATYEQVKTPSLIIGGEKDVQCNPDDVGIIADILGPLAEAHLLEDLTHLLRMEEGEASFSNYNAQIKRPMAPEVLDLVANWTTRFVARDAQKGA